MRIRSLLAALLLFVSAACFGQAQLRIVCWNLEGNGQASLAFIEEALEDKEGVHLWGLSEVRPDRADEFATAVGADEPGSFQSILGTTGGGIRLQIVFDADKLELISSEELTDEFDDLADVSRQRIPLVAHFRGRTTGQEFKFVVLHLNRGNSSLRHQQATTLRAWAIAQSVPVIMGGDCNFDYHVFNGDAGARDAGFDNLTSGGLVTWLRPMTLVKTEDSDSFVTVLDFVFYANAPAGWSGESRILEREGDVTAVALDFDDDATTPDHRPIDAIITFAGRDEPDDDPDMEERDDAIQAILGRIEQLQAELQELREAVQALQE